MSWFYLIMLLLVTGATLWRVYKNPRTRSPKNILGTLILYLIFFGIGFVGIWSFLGHVFYADQTADSIGWNTGSPFQFEVGMANLAFGVLGILCLWEKEDFWLATALGASIYLFGCGIGHAWQVVSRHNLSPNNAGAVLYVDLIFPVVLLVLIMIHRRLRK